MSELPIKFQDFYLPIEAEIFREALTIAWDGMQRAKRWNDVKGLSAEAALRESCNDIQQAMRRIEDIVKHECPGSN